MSAFSLYVDRNSRLNRLNPLTMLAVVGFCLVAGLALPAAWMPYVVVGLILVPLAAWGRVLRPLLSAASKIVLPFAVSVFLIQGLFWTAGTPVVHLGPLSLKREGLLFAAQSTGRILAVLGSFLLLSLTTRPDALMIALSQRGVPKSLTYIVLATIQIAPRFQAKANTILDAQRARGLETEGGIGRRARAVVPLVVPLAVGGGEARRGGVPVGHGGGNGGGAGLSGGPGGRHGRGRQPGRGGDLRLSGSAAVECVGQACQRDRRSQSPKARHGPSCADPG